MWKKTLTCFSYVNVDLNFPFSTQLKITITSLLLLSLIISQTMADHREAHTHRESEGDREFSFWNSSNTTIHSNIDCNQIGGGIEASLNRKEAVFGEKAKRKNSKLEYSPFLPRSHRFSSVPDPSRSKAIEEGRKELMEMMKGMPESTFELSFQDMVIDEKQIHQDETSEEKTLIKSSSSNNKALIKKPSDKKKSKCNRPNQISRVESMDSETFLLKMFFPTTLKKVKMENGSKVSPRPSLPESAKYWRVKSFFQAKDNKGHTEHSISKNTTTNHDKSRDFDRNISFSQGCWPFLHYTKKKVEG